LRGKKSFKDPNKTGRHVGYPGKLEEGEHPELKKATQREALAASGQAKERGGEGGDQSIPGLGEGMEGQKKSLIGKRKILLKDQR